jgi:Ca2+-binding EF-hand superfamily protein
VSPPGLQTLGRQTTEAKPDGQVLGLGAVSLRVPVPARARAQSVRASVRASVRVQQQQLVAPRRPAAESDDGDNGEEIWPTGKQRWTMSSIDSPDLFKAVGPEPEHFRPVRIAEGKSKQAASRATSREDVQDRVSNVLWRERSVPSQRGKCSRCAELVESTHFEMIMGVIIVLNGLQMAIELQYSGLKLGYDLGYREYANNPDPWPGANTILKAIGILFGAIFLCEVSVKICALRGAFFKLHWNIFDLMVVLFWLVEMSSLLKDNLENTTALRLARLARLLRLVRVVRQIRSFDALFLMTTAIRSSLIVLAWSCMLLLLVQMLVAFAINQLLEEFYFPGDHPQNEVEDVFEYFGSFSRALLSTFEMTLANWPPVCRLLMENVSEWFMVLCLVHKLTIGFAVLGVINGVFIQETFRVAAQDDFIMVHQKEASTRIHLNKMSRLFHTGDVSGDGLLDRTEFMQLMENEEVMTWLSSMGLDVGDANFLFEYLDKDDDGNVSAEELIKGVSCLKGSARSLDLIMCLNRVDEMYQALQEVHPEIVKDRCRGLVFTSRWGPADPAVGAARSSGYPSCESARTSA